MFRQADFTWGLSQPLLLVVAAAVALAVAAMLTYRGLSSTVDRMRDRVVLGGLRLAALAAPFFCLVRPTLILKAAVPQQNFLRALVYDSRSIAIAHRDGQTRAELIKEH